MKTGESVIVLIPLNIVVNDFLPPYLCLICLFICGAVLCYKMCSSEYESLMDLAADLLFEVEVPNIFLALVS